MNFNTVNDIRYIFYIYDFFNLQALTHKITRLQSPRADVTDGSTSSRGAVAEKCKDLTSTSPLGLGDFDTKEPSTECSEGINNPIPSSLVEIVKVKGNFYCLKIFTVANILCVIYFTFYISMRILSYVSLPYR